MEELNSVLGSVLSIEREVYVDSIQEGYKQGTRLAVESILQQARQNGLKTYKSMKNIIVQENLNKSKSMKMLKDTLADYKNKLNRKQEEISISEKWNTISNITALEYLINEYKS